MSIEVTCPSCGKVLRAKDSAAGRKARCPQCRGTIQIPETVCDAEVDDSSGSDGYDEYGYSDYGYDDYGNDGYGFDMDDVQNAPRALGTGRKPCPMCGEMIVSNAAKCRYCGEIFDAKLRKKAKKEKKRTVTDEDSELTGADLFVALVCTTIGCILGIIWLVQGKPKGIKMIGLSILAPFLWHLIGFLVATLMRGVN